MPAPGQRLRFYPYRPIPKGDYMIYTIIALAAIGYLVYRLGNTPEAIEIDNRVKAARDEHLRKMNEYGIRL